MHSTYLLLPIGIFSLLLYLLSYMMVKTGIITRLLHRRIWNVILLITFLGMAVLGILLVIEINYKLEWKTFDALQKWHVDLGIAMSFVAFFHLAEHFSFYSRLFKPQKQQKKAIKEKQSDGFLDKNKYPVLILILGFLSTVVQVLFMREVTSLFQGNELLMGWTIGSWMLLTGTGAWLGGRKQGTTFGPKHIYYLLFLLSMLPFIVILAIDIVKPLLFPPGLTINPAIFLGLILLFLAPVSLLCGYSYAVLVVLYQKDYIRVYSLESIGSLLGGLVVSFLMIKWFGVLQSSLLLALPILLVLYIHGKQKRAGIVALLVFPVLILFFVFHLDLKIKSLQYINQQVLEDRETYYGNLVVTANSDQYNFYGNGELLFTTNDVIVNEETTHYAMMQHENPRTVLLVSGGASGMIGEILKYKSVERLDYVELNPELIKLASKYNPLPDDHRLKIHYTDGRRFIRKSGLHYDVAIFAVPGPSSLQYNRFYTAGFMELLKKRLNDKAVVLFGIPAAGNYITLESINIGAPVYHALKKFFKNVEIIPGDKDYFVASDAAITSQIAKLAAIRNVENSYVNPFYIDDFSIQQRGEQIKRRFADTELVNTDERPLPVFYHSLQFINHFSNRKLFFLLIPVIVLLLPLFFMTPVSGAMYITGFTASSVELLLIFLFQVVFGYVYSAIGIIIALFMGGLAIGAVIGYHFRITRKHFLIGQSLLIVYALLFPLLWKWQNWILSGVWGWVLFVPITLIPAAVVGFQYVTSTKFYSPDLTRGAAVIYSADLWGGALGTVLLTLIMIPFLGVIYSSLVLAVANMLIVLLNTVKTN